MSTTDGPSPKRERPLILHVDDSPFIAKVIKDMVLKLGCDVVSASSGEKCLLLAKERLPDAILMDAIMPNMDGYQTTAALKQDPALKDIPVIMLTGEETNKAEASGANGYLPKPVQAETLAGKLKEFIALPPAS
jgi:CheY-like chemotaxis protein